MRLGGTRRLRAAAVTIFLCVASLNLLSVPPAQAVLTFDVEVGRFFDETDHTAESMRFYPSAIKVVPGDTLHFTTESFHGVTLLPEGSEPAAWTNEYTEEPGALWSVFVPDRDEGSKAAKVNTRVALPSKACGWPGQGPCEFDGSGDPGLDALNSGLALFPTAEGSETRELSFSVTITAEPGAVLYALDPLHPAMTMRIDVVGSFEERSDPFELEDAAEAQFAADRARAAQLDRSYSKKRVKKNVGGTTVWQAWAGVEEPGISLRRFYPKKLTIKPKHQVKWIFSKNIYEAHDVTFPRGKASSLGRGFPQIVCDTNGDQTTDGDSGPTSTEFPFCSSVGQLELDVASALVAGAGDGKITSARDFATSGARGASYAPSAKSYLLTFPKKSTRTGYSYACAIHEAAHAPMRGTVVVRR